MPLLARFNGIAVRMYFCGSEHNPPHIHALFGGSNAVFDIDTGIILAGVFPVKASALVKVWIEENKNELLNMWETQEFKKLNPLT